MFLFAVTVVAVGLIALAFVFGRPALAVVLTAVACFSLAPVFQGEAGTPAGADGRLAREQWRLLSVAPLPEDIFLVSVRYQAGDIRTYALALQSQEAKDRFLKAAQSLKKGRVMIGKAKRGRAGLIDESEMQFEFGEAPEAEPKNPPAPAT